MCEVTRCPPRRAAALAVRRSACSRLRETFPLVTMERPAQQSQGVGYAAAGGHQPVAQSYMRKEPAVHEEGYPIRGS